MEVVARRRTRPGSVPPAVVVVEERPASKFYGQGVGYQTNAGRHEHLRPEEAEEFVGHSNQSLLADLQQSFPAEVIARITQTLPDGRTSVLTLPPSEAVRLAVEFHGEKYAAEYALRTVHRLLLRNVPTDQIARMFDVTIRTVSNWKRKLRDRLALEVARIDPNPLVGDALAFFNEVRGTAMQSAAGASNDHKTMARMLDVALRAELAKQHTLASWGVVAAKPVTFATDGYKGASDAKDMYDMVTAIIKGESAVDEMSELGRRDESDEYDEVRLIGG